MLVSDFRNPKTVIAIYVYVSLVFSHLISNSGFYIVIPNSHLSSRHSIIILYTALYTIGFNICFKQILPYIINGPSDLVSPWAQITNLATLPYQPPPLNQTVQTNIFRSSTPWSPNWFFSPRSTHSHPKRYTSLSHTSQLPALNEYTTIFIILYQRIPEKKYFICLFPFFFNLTIFWSQKAFQEKFKITDSFSNIKSSAQSVIQNRRGW